METNPPMLVISHGRFMQNHLTYNLSENGLRALNKIPILCGAEILASSYGWLVLMKPRTDQCCLWNPTSMQIIDLPKLLLASVYSICVLSKPPTEPDCHVLFNSASTLEQSFCRVGDEEYSHEYKVEDNGKVRKLRAVGSFQGKIYGFVDPGNLFVTIHFVGKTLEFRPIMTVDEPWRELAVDFSTPYYNIIWMIESPKLCGGDSGSNVELLLVQKLYSCKYTNDRLDFRVFQIDLRQMKCVELDSIGERAIFLSHDGGGFCCLSSDKVKANSIYYTDLYKRSLYMFDLEDKGTTSLLPPCVAAGYTSVTAWVENRVLTPHLRHLHCKN